MMRLLVPILGALVCLAMILSLSPYTQLSALIWMVIGLVIYFAWSKNKSKLNKL